MSTPVKTDLYYIHLFNDYSGSPRVLRDAIDSDVHCAKNTYVFTSQHPGFLDDVNAKRVRCFYARSDNRYLQLCYFLIAQVLLFIQLFGYLLLGKVKGRQSTVLINTMLPFGAAAASKLLAKKIIYYVHETYIQPEALKRFLRFFIEHCASHVIFVSQYLSQQEAFKKPMQNVIYNGLRSDFSVNNNLDFVAKFAGKKLFFAGSLKRYKGIDKLVELARVLPDFNVIAALNCQADELDRFKAEVEPPNNMTFVIRPANIQQYFASSFLVLNLSSVDNCIETFGLSLIEGMALATPVIAPPIGGPTEFVTKKNGALIDAEELEDITAFIGYLNSSEQVWRTYADEAYLTAKSFSAEQYKQSFKSYFKQYDLL